MTSLQAITQTHRPSHHKQRPSSTIWDEEPGKKSKGSVVKPLGQIEVGDGLRTSALLTALECATDGCTRPPYNKTELCKKCSDVARYAAESRALPRGGD